MAAAVGYTLGTRTGALLGAGLFMLSYVFDNCDGEVARSKHISSRWGTIFDTASDSLVNMLIFPAIGYGLMRMNGNTMWLWIGVLGGLGAAINSAMAIRRDYRWATDTPLPPDTSPAPQSLRDWLNYLLRALGRADFCFVLAAATLLNVQHWLLIAGAIGAQAYWLMAFWRGADEYHV